MKRYDEETFGAMIELGKKNPLSKEESPLSQKALDVYQDEYFGDCVVSWNCAWAMESLVDEGFRIEGVCDAWEKAIVAYDPDGAGIFNPTAVEA